MHGKHYNENEQEVSKWVIVIALAFALFMTRGYVIALINMFRTILGI